MSYGEVNQFDKTVSYEDMVSSRHQRQRRNGMANIFYGIDENLVRNLLRQQSASGEDELEVNDDENNDEDIFESRNISQECGSSDFVSKDGNNNCDTDHVTNESSLSNDVEMKDMDSLYCVNRSHNALDQFSELFEQKTMQDTFMEIFDASLMDAACVFSDCRDDLVEYRAMSVLNDTTLGEQTQKVDDKITDADAFCDNYCDKVHELHGIIKEQNDRINDQCFYDVPDSEITDDFYPKLQGNNGKPFVNLDNFMTDSALRCRRNGMAGILDSLTESDIKHLHHVFSIRPLVIV